VTEALVETTNTAAAQRPPSGVFARPEFTLVNSGLAPY
jgi:hypothetical protein